MTPVSIQSVWIRRAEGPSNRCVEETFDSMEKAQRWIDGQSFTYPTLGYDKHDFKLTWEDGSHYAGRLDCKFSMEPMENHLATHVLDFVKYLLKRHDDCEDMLTDKEYTDLQKIVDGHFALT